MLLTRVLEILTWSIWIVYGAGVGLYLWQTVRSRGLGRTLRGLFTAVPLGVLFIAMVLTLFYRSAVFVEPEEAGVVVSLVSPEGYRDRPLRSGLRWIVPFCEEVTLYPIYWQTYTMASKPTEGQKPGDDSILARTADGQEVSIDSSVIFQIDPEEVIRIHIEWQGRYMEDFVRPIVRGLVRTQVSQYTVDEVNSSKRLDLERDLDNQVRAVFKVKGLILDRFILRTIAFSQEYADAVEQKQVALQGKIQAEYQAEQVRKLALGEADATRTKAQAEADALAMISQVIAKNRDLLTYQYIEKLSPALKAMLVPSNGSYILPVPTFDEPNRVATSVPAPQTTPTAASTLAASATPPASRASSTPTRKP